MVSPQGSPLPFAGTPYAHNQLAAQQAYQNALAQLTTQRNQLMTQYGFNPGTGQVLSSPTSLYGQMSNSIQHMEDAAGSNILARGLSANSGLGAQTQEAANYQRDLALSKFGQGYENSLSRINTALLGASQKYNSQSVNNRLALINWLIGHGQFTHAARRKG